MCLCAYLLQMALGVLHAPVPFLVGTHHSFLSGDVTIPDGVCVVDLDKNHLRLPRVVDEERGTSSEDAAPVSLRFSLFSNPYIS